MREFSLITVKYCREGQGDRQLQQFRQGMQWKLPITDTSLKYTFYLSEYVFKQGCVFV